MPVEIRFGEPEPGFRFAGIGLKGTGKKVGGTLVFRFAEFFLPFVNQHGCVVFLYRNVVGRVENVAPPHEEEPCSA